MFEAFVFVCMLKDPTNCRTLADTQGPYRTEAVELPDWMPEYLAIRYKCDNKGQGV